MAWDAIVVGGGLGGLTAGALCATAGQRVLLVEKNETVGGAATCFRRGERRFEVSLHETTHPDSGADPKGRIFRALDLMEKVEFVPIPEYCRVKAPHLGLDLRLPHGLAPLKEALTEAFPEQRKEIAAFLRQIGRTQEAISLFVERHDGAWWRANLAELPLDLWAVVRDFRGTLSEVMQRYFGSSEALKLALTANLFYYTDNPDTFWWLAYAVAQGGFFKGGGYYIKGGSVALSNALAGIITANGGTILTGIAAEEILCNEHGAVCGLRLADGRVETTSCLFGNASPHALAAMLPPEQARTLRDSFADRQPSISLFEASIALDRPGSALGIDTYSTAFLPDWMTNLSDFAHAAPILGQPPGGRLPPMIVVDYGQIESGLADEAPAPVSITGIDRLENWAGLSDEAYRARKRAWLDALIARCDAAWPGFAAAVASADLATARTMAQYLGSPGGAVYGFAPRPPRLSMPGPRGQVRSNTPVPGLWLASAYAGFGGYTGAMGGGAMAAQRALRSGGSAGVPEGGS
jgi:phytoene dehydrogenase-like protein